MMLNAMDFKAVAESRNRAQVRSLHLAFFPTFLEKVSAEGWAYLYSAAGDEFSYAENEDAFSR